MDKRLSAKFESYITSFKDDIKNELIKMNTRTKFLWIYYACIVNYSTNHLPIYEHSCLY